MSLSFSFRLSLSAFALKLRRMPGSSQSFRMTNYTPSSSGTRVPVVDVMVVDENGKKLPPGHTGEIWVRGPNAMKCYYGDPGRWHLTDEEGS